LAAQIAPRFGNPRKALLCAGFFIAGARQLLPIFVFPSRNNALRIDTAQKFFSKNIELRQFPALKAYSFTRC
jgi:hypothetical protein